MEHMLQVDDVLEDTSTGAFMRVIHMDETSAAVEWTQPPGMPKLAGGQMHAHRWTQTFEFVSGVGTYTLDDGVYELEPGDTVVIEPGQRHDDPYVCGDEPFVYVNRIENTVPGHAEDQFLWFATLYGLANEGKLIRSLALPSNPLQ
ncbi:MAG: cupin domain-containing protein, partial [Chloroflexota bacterium]